MRVAVLDDYQRVAAELADWRPLTRRAEVEFFHDALATEEEVVARLAGFDVVCLMRERTPMPAAVIGRLPRLRLIVTTGMANAAIDLAAAAAGGVAVCGTQMGGPETAEFAWLAIAAVMRGLPAELQGVREGGWQVGLGRRLGGSTLGLLGLGNLGGAVARYARAFDMTLLAASANLTDERAAEVGAERVGLDELFARSDVVSIHLKLSARTRGLVGADHLGLLGPSGYLVNTSRGPIVDERALIEAIREGRIAGAAIDTWDTEPLPADHPLRDHPRVLATPHLAYVTRESYTRAYAQTVDAVLAWMEGAPVRLLGGS